MHHAPLKPNCLLTRYPIVLLKRKSWRSLFRSAEYRHLSEHGYDTIELQFTSTSDQLFSERQRRRLADVACRLGPIHLIYDNEFSNALSGSLSAPDLIFKTAQSRRLIPPDGLLQYAISLAEKDIQCSH
jgi:hypothetical protein